ncbi:MAG TPA: protein kinase, partial [Vicinamibacterales bacterium]|nr:protein kinase [Vicinamibacterales bacterium]
ARSDIFSFGALLYEMVTGTRAFDGGSQASIIGAILERDPPPMAARMPLTPPALERVVRKCLAKDPERRWQSGADLGDELAWIAQSSGVVQPSGAVKPRRFGRVSRAAAGAALIIAMLGGALAWALVRSSPATVVPPWHLSIAVPEGARVAPGGIAVSPDGKTIVYSASSSQAAEGAGSTAAEGITRLYVRQFDAQESIPLPGTEGARTPFFSVDGLSVGFFTDTALMKVSLLGGRPIRISAAPPVARGAAWLPDDSIVLAPTQSFGLHRLASGAEMGEELTTLDESRGEKGHQWPSVLPGGEYVLYTVRHGTASNEEAADVGVVHVATRTQALVLKDAAYARYSPTGHLLFVRGGNLMAVPFDLATRKTEGTPVPVVHGLSVSGLTAGAHYAVAPDGTLVVMRGSFGEADRVATWVDRSGKPIAAPEFAATSGPRISPDGTRAVFGGVSAERDSEIYMADLARGTTVRFSADPREDFNATWTPDGRRVIWAALMAGGRAPFLVWRSSDGTGAAEEIMPRTDEAQFMGSVSRDGILAYSQTRGGRICDIWTVPLTGTRTPRPFIHGTALEYGPEFSPDGKWIAYVSDEAGARDVYVVPYPGPGAKRRVTVNGGVAPSWSRDGRELFYQTPEGLMSVPVSATADIQFGAPRLLFGGGFLSESREDAPREYDVAPGATRFLMTKSERKSGDIPPSLDVIFNWAAAMTARGARR